MDSNSTNLEFRGERHDFGFASAAAAQCQRVFGDEQRFGSRLNGGDDIFQRGRIFLAQLCAAIWRAKNKSGEESRKVMEGCIY